MSQDTHTVIDGPASAFKCLLYTNRYNLLDFLSSEFVKPAGLIHKYHSDLGERIPGHLLLFLTPIAAHSLPEGAEDEFPVALEIVLPQTGREVPVLRADGTLGTASLDHINEVEISAVLLPGPLPMTFVKAIHYRSEQEREEFVLRRFEDTREFCGPHLVSPQVFDKVAQPVILSLEPLQTLHSDPSLPRWYERFDRLLGAYALALSEASFARLVGSAGAISAIAWAQATPSAADLGELIAFRNRLQDLLSPHRSESTWLPLFPLILGQLQQGQNPDQIVKTVLKGLPAKGRSSLEVADLCLLAVILSVLEAHDARKTSPDELLSELEISFRGCFGRSVSRAKDVEEIQGRYTRAFALIREVRQGLRDLASLSNWPTGTEVLKALLLFSLKPDPHRTPRWATEPESRYLSAGDLTLALMLSGLFHGLSRLPVQLRPTGDADAILSRVRLSLMGQQTPLIASLKPVQVAPKIGPDSGGRITQRGIERVIPVDLSEGVVIEVKTIDDLRDVLDGLKEPVSKLAKETAQLLAEKMGWGECFSHVLVLTGVPYALECNGRQTLLRVDRPVEFRREFNESQFKKKFSNFAVENIPFDTRLLLARLIGRNLPDSEPPSDDMTPVTISADSERTT